MNREQTAAVGYDEFFLKPDKERIKIFRGITSDNRAFLVKTHAERWLAVNRSRLDHEQVAVVEELILLISPDWYEAPRDFDIHPEAEAMVKKIEAALPREDLRQLAANGADYIPAVEDEEGSNKSA